MDPHDRPKAGSGREKKLHVYTRPFRERERVGAGALELGMLGDPLLTRHARC